MNGYNGYIRFSQENGSKSPPDEDRQGDDRKGKIMKEEIVLRIARPSFIPKGKYLKHGRGRNMPLWKDCETEDFYLSFGDWKSKVNDIIQSFAVNPVAPFKEFIETKTGVKDNPFSTSHVIEPPAADEFIKEYAAEAGLDVTVLWTVARAEYDYRGTEGFAKGCTAQWHKAAADRLLESEKKIVDGHAAEFEKIYQDPKSYWAEGGQLTSHGVYQESLLREKLHTQIVTEAGLIESYDNSGGLWALTSEAPLKFTTDYPC